MGEIAEDVSQKWEGFCAECHGSDGFTECMNISEDAVVIDFIGWRKTCFPATWQRQRTSSGEYREAPVVSVEGSRREGVHQVGFHRMDHCGQMGRSGYKLLCQLKEKPLVGFITRKGGLMPTRLQAEPMCSMTTIRPSCLSHSEGHR
ncbi:unnamed protein product [Victoria cruziana]